MAIIITAPNEMYSVKNSNNIKLFLAGSITGAEPWQTSMIDSIQKRPALSDNVLTVYNPRRENFPMDDKSESERQIIWEHNNLRDANIISFWFAKDTISPITLYELGMWVNRKITVIGIEDGYLREQDVRVRTQLTHPKKHIETSISGMVDAIQEICIEW